MSNYLSYIAARNMESDQPLLAPARGFASAMGIDPFQEALNPANDFTVSPQNDAPPQQNTILPRQKSEYGKNQVKPLLQNTAASNSGKSVQNKTIETSSSYITKYVDRLNFNENGEQQEPALVKNSVNPQEEKNSVKTKIVSDNVEITGGKRFEKKEFQNRKLEEIEAPFVVSKKKSKIKPSPENISSESKIALANSSRATRMNPLQPSFTPANTKNNNTKPKLVIGKITVEIIQANKPLPARVINRIVQSPPSSDNSKRSKFSFGLGQL
jgi:hypothetical protein